MMYGEEQKYWAQNKDEIERLQAEDRERQMEEFGKSMNLSVIAEGVETGEQAAFLLRHGCNQAQGYFYSKPLAAEVMLERWKSTLPDTL